MMRRARLLAVIGIVVAGGIGVISSTQAWLVVTLVDGGGAALPVPGTAAVPVLAPVSLAMLALGLALSIAGTVLRHVFGVLAAAAGGVLAFLTAGVMARPLSAVASTVTGATGISGADAVTGLVATVSPTPWPAVTLAGWVLLTTAGVFTVVTARRWRSAGRRFRTDTATDQATADAAPAAQDASARLDAIDSWDGLSRGEDPTERGRPG